MDVFYEVDALKIRIEQRLSNFVDPETRLLLESVYKHLLYYEDIAKRTLHTDLYDAIKSELRHTKRMVCPGYDRYFPNNLENLKIKLETFTPRLKMMEEQWAEGLYESFPNEDEDEEEDDGDRDAVSTKVIGVAEVYEELKKKLTNDRIITSLVGMPGIGKTALAKKVLQDPTIMERFDHCVLIQVGKKCRLKDIPRRILAAMDPQSLQTLPEGDDKAVHAYLKESLRKKRHLIVLDDVWDKYMAYLLDPYPRCIANKLEHPFLHPESRSRIFLTSRLQQVDPDNNPLSTHTMIEMRLLKENESWDLFREKVFSGGPCPSQLWKAGKKISENCEGLPLTILTVAHLLSDEKKNTPEYWNEVAENKNHQLFKKAYDEISKVLISSYTYLPPLLQICFLYMGVFPQEYKIPRSKLINLWIADGFDEINMDTYLDTRSIGYLLELVINNLVVVYQESFSNRSYKVKFFGLHSSLWHLSNKKAKETKFALVLRSRGDGLGDDVKGQRRLSFHNNVLFGIKEVNQSVEDKCKSSTQYLLCYGPYQQYEVRVCFGLKLLRELDALLIHFYKFPVEVVQLVWLRYLALTLNGMIPASISQLSNLQFLIVDRHLNIKSCKGPSYLPVDIWKMKELKHLQVAGSDLPDPCGGSLESLSTLLNVSTHSCTETVFNAIPNLKKLGIQIELVPDDDGKAFSCFTQVSHLDELDILKCVVINPMAGPPATPLPKLGLRYLKKLNLSGMGYPWKEMNKISSLRFLNVLKLKNYAFQGREWEVEKGEFHCLSSLVIEDTDLVNWNIGYEALRRLLYISIKHCYKLQNIQWDFRYKFTQIEIVDCSPSFVEEWKKNALENATKCVLNVHSSWDDTKLRA